MKIFLIYYEFHQITTKISTSVIKKPFYLKLYLKKKMGKKPTPAETAKTHNNKSNSGRTMMEIDPDIIYFTHARIRPVFTGCNKRIQDTIDEIKSGVTSVSQIPYITIIENTELVYVQPQEVGKHGANKGQNKRNNRRDDFGDEDDDLLSTKRGKGGKLVPPQTTTQSFYFSLNNRRLFLFKTLKSMGLVDKITVYVKPALEREKQRYTRQRCAIMAKIMSKKELEEAGDEEVDGGGEESAEGNIIVENVVKKKQNDENTTQKKETIGDEENQADKIPESDQ
jgi:hypothetical protein